MVDDALRIGLQALLVTGFLISPERYAGYLLSSRGRGWLALYLTCGYAAAFYCFAPHRNAFDNALISLFYPCAYLATLYFIDREQRKKKAMNGAKPATPIVTAADTPSTPPGRAP